MKYTDQEIKLVIIKKLEELPLDDEITMESNLGYDLGLDSLDKVELFMNIELELDVLLPDELYDKTQTVGDMFNHLRNHLK